MNFKNTRVYQFLKEMLLVRIASLALKLKRKSNLPSQIYTPARKFRISYCTTCMGRTHHLKKTYVRNILDNIEYDNVEFVLVNYDSYDNMSSWVKQNLKDYIASGTVKYYETHDVDNFHASKAKNLSHRLATGDILVNLDADNYAGKDNAYFVNDFFINHPEGHLLQFTASSWLFFDTVGRIAIKRDDFFKVNGYREDFAPFKMQDYDLIKRCELIGIKTNQVGIVNFLKSVKHGDEERIKNLKSKKKMQELQRENSMLMRKGLKRGNFKANRNGFEKYEVVKNFGNKSFRI